MQFQVLNWRLFLIFAFDILVIGGAPFLIRPSPDALQRGVTVERTAANGRRFQFDVGPLNRNYVHLQDISRFLRAAVIALEDTRFYDHGGLDLEEILNALYTYQRGGRLRGASTLTQQLAKNLYLTHERTFKRKFLEALISISLEARLSKNKILELYLNSIEWGRGLIGIKQASQFYFKKAPRDLTLQESVFLAAIIPNPTRFGRLETDELPKKFVRRQMARALQILYDQDFISLEQFEEALLHPLELAQ